MTDPQRPRLAVTVVDGGTGPWMFLVHGMLTGSLQWTPNLASLKRFVRPVLFDLWGHGASPAQREERAAELERDGAAAVARMPIHPRNARRLPESIRERLVAAADRVAPHAAARLLTITGPALSVADDLHRIACPTLLVNGLWERKFQPLRALAAQRIPGCRVADVDAGHAVNLENPEAFDAAVAAFLSQVLPRA